MNRLILLAATIVLSTGMMLAQNSPAATDKEQPNASPDQMQRGRPRATPPILPHQPPDTSANPDRPEAAPPTTLSSTTIDDQQPGNSTTGSPSSTMGTTGSTPGTEQSSDGNKSGAKPDNTQTPDTKPTQPHDRYASGSSNPNSSANGASSDDMSGTNPKPDNKPDDTTNSPHPQAAPPHIATHAPDAGTEMNPASVELVTATTVQH